MTMSKHRWAIIEALTKAKAEGQFSLGLPDDKPAQLLEVHWYLNDWDDEVVVHETTFEGCAKFLHEGSKSDDIEPPGVPGDIYGLSALVLFKDGAATWTEDHGWQLQGPFDIWPCDFGALRYGPGLGWDPDTIFDPSNVQSFREVAEEWDAEASHRIEDIALGRMLSGFRARFVLAEDGPQLVLLDPDDDGRPCSADAFMAALCDHVTDANDVVHAIGCWVHGAWDEALSVLPEEGRLVLSAPYRQGCSGSDAETGEPVTIEPPKDEVKA